MKAVIFVLASLISGAAIARPSTCETYAAADEIDAFKVVNPATDALTEIEKGMIQTTILVGNPGQPMSVEQAIHEFTDADHGGSNGGDISYSAIQVGSRTRTVVRVTYFPGDNEYGLLFQQTSTQSGIYVDMIGTIQDGDVVCLSYWN